MQPGTEPQTAEFRVDLTRYRTPELFDRVMNLVDLPGTLRKWFIWLAAMVVTLLAGTWLVFADLVSTPLLVGLLLWAAIGGFLVANFLCLCHTIDGALSDVGGLVEVTLDTVRAAAADLGQARSGQFPSASELVRASYRDVTLPILEKVIAERVWIVGKPLLWVYRRSLGKLIGLAIDRLPVEKLEADGGEQLLKRHMQRAEQLHAKREAIERYASRLGEIAASMQRGVRKWAMRPLYGVACLLVIALLVPLAVVYWFQDVDGTEPPAATSSFETGTARR